MAESKKPLEGKFDRPAWLFKVPGTSIATGASSEWAANEYGVVMHGQTSGTCRAIKREWWQFWRPKYREVWTITRSGPGRPTVTTIEEAATPLFPAWLHDAIERRKA